MKAVKILFRGPFNAPMETPLEKYIIVFDDKTQKPLGEFINELLYEMKSLQAKVKNLEMKR